MVQIHYLLKILIDSNLTNYGFKAVFDNVFRRFFNLDKTFVTYLANKLIKIEQGNNGN